MTIEQVGEQPIPPGKTVASCVWFEVSSKRGVVKRVAFPPSALGTASDDAERLSSTASYF